MDTELANMLGEIHGSLGRIEQKIDSHKEAFDKHVEMDMEAYKAIGEQGRQIARQKGFLAGMGAVGGLIGAVATWAADRLLRG
jgi:hypothetical protein